MNPFETFWHLCGWLADWVMSPRCPWCRRKINVNGSNIIDEVGRRMHFACLYEEREAERLAGITPVGRLMYSDSEFKVLPPREIMG